MRQSLNVSGFYTGLLGFLDHMVAAGVLKQKNRKLLLTAETVDDLLTRMEAWTPKDHPKWMTQKQA